MKTLNEILTDMYKIIKDSPIDALSGSITKRMRHTDSELEDCVINVITGTNGKFLQDGAVTVLIYYKDIYSENTYFEDSVRGQVLEELLQDLSATLLNTPGYSFQVQTRETYTAAVPELKQHYAILKINFKTLI